MFPLLLNKAVSTLRLDRRRPWRRRRKPINLALQGGGAHGAFTWGVLDQILTDGRLTIMGLPLSFDGERPPFRRAAPRLGEHTEELLAPPAQAKTVSRR